VPALYYGSLIVGGIALLALMVYLLSFFIEGLSKLGGAVIKAVIPLALLAGAAYLIYLIVEGRLSF
jgi:hypothetical protein